MSASIIPQLVKKDFMIHRQMILIFSLVSFATIGVLSFLYGRIPDRLLLNIALTLLLAPIYNGGFALLMKTTVFEKEKSTQPFIMSLPVTMREFTVAKLLVNLPVFGALWLLITGVAFFFSFVLGLFPLGTVPFMTMVFLGVFVAYIGILSVSLLFQSVGSTVSSVLFFELGTFAYLCGIAYLDPIARYVHGPNIVWNATAIIIVTIQLLIAALMIATTLLIQNKK